MQPARMATKIARPDGRVRPKSAPVAAAACARLERALVDGAPIMTELALSSRAAYRALVHDDPGFASFFRDITPDPRAVRPAARVAAGGARPGRGPTIDSLRAIPWTFAWSQSRINLPGWFGLGHALEAYRYRAR